jgi:hypothetical protein
MLEYRCLSSTIDWRFEAVMVIHDFDLWYLEETKFLDESSFDVDYQW